MTLYMNDKNVLYLGSFWIEFIDFMIKGKSLLDYTNLFSPNEYEKIYKIILNYIH